jgi:Zn finger protein HypA/HybF involved in hydrogenase expression
MYQETTIEIRRNIIKTSNSNLVDENTLLECEECKKYSKVLDYKEGETYCEDCGTHPALICPLCGHYHDEIYSVFIIKQEGIE